MNLHSNDSSQATLIARFTRHLPLTTGASLVRANRSMAQNPQAHTPDAHWWVHDCGVCINYPAAPLRYEAGPVCWAVWTDIVPTEPCKHPGHCVWHR